MIKLVNRQLTWWLTDIKKKSGILIAFLFQVCYLTYKSVITHEMGYRGNLSTELFHMHIL